ncbi:MAG: FUSC family protein [Winogradskyella sp.]|uniref:FUSC family protein n=1 Tax=Winogradskyella sp. TaxID=1883156 RepID=UPI000F3D4A1B|nr:FUSC family protein [Winogradskyella sp.]RNC86451.1 MAG: FUSC family protein [Winogradskyella sp.]
MKKLLIILGFIASILAVVLAVTPLFKLSVFPIIIAFLCGIALLYFSKKKKFKTKAIQYVFLLTIISLSFTVYKSVFQKAEIGDIKELEQLDETSEEDAIKELEDIEIM